MFLFSPSCFGKTKSCTWKQCIRPECGTAHTWRDQFRASSPRTATAIDYQQKSSGPGSPTFDLVLLGSSTEVTRFQMFQTIILREWEICLGWCSCPIFWGKCVYIKDYIRRVYMTAFCSKYRSFTSICNHFVCLNTTIKPLKYPSSPSKDQLTKTKQQLANALKPQIAITASNTKPHHQTQQKAA